MRIVAISDTHTCHQHLELPDGDVLVHAGDFSHPRDEASVRLFLRWFAQQPHKHKIFIAGNHDGLFETDPRWCESIMPDGLTYLLDSGVTIDEVKFWGSPWQPEFCAWHFNLPRGDALAQKWSLIPDDTDVLITHAPPMGTLDECPAWHPTFSTDELEHAGCEELAKAVERVNPRVHIFGHIHEGAGVEKKDGRTYINAAQMDRKYKPVSQPRVVDL